jgi:hypothetical protein
MPRKKMSSPETADPAKTRSRKKARPADELQEADRPEPKTEPDQGPAKAKRVRAVKAAPQEPSTAPSVPTEGPDPAPARKPPRPKRKAPTAQTGPYEEAVPVAWRPLSAATLQPAAEDRDPLSGAAPAKSRAQGQELMHAPPAERPDPEKPARARGHRSGPRPQSPDPQTAPPFPTVKPKPELATKRTPVTIPDDAAQVIVRNGVPTLVKDKRAYPPVMFFASVPDEGRLATVLEEIKHAAENGVHLYSLLVELEVDPKAVDEAVAFAAYLLKRVVSVNERAQLVFRLVFAAPTHWEKHYPKAKYLLNEGGLADPSLCDDDYWTVAEECEAAFIRKLRRLDSGGHVMGVHLERGEWFFAEGTGYDTSPAGCEAFRKWLRARYLGDAVSLRASWFDGSVDFDTVSVPEYGRARPRHEEFVRTDRRGRPWVDYHLFLSDSTVERIARLANVAKVASEGRYLVGVSYGYTFEWAHPASGHLSLGKLLRCPDVDYVAGPPSYRNREPGGSCPFPGPIDSFALNGKLYVSEEDFKTPISGMREPDDFNPVMKTPQALENVHWRGAGAALAHSSGVAWMDTWGNGWLDSPGIWARAGQILKSTVQASVKEPAAPEIAVLIDERSLAYLTDERAFTVLVQNVREAVLRSGLSAGFYLLSDLAHRETFPESKVYVFLNAWDMRPEVRAAVKSRLQRSGNVLFWFYCAGLFEGGRESLERVREVTGIALRPQPFNSKTGTTLLNFRDPLCENLPERLLAQGGHLEPSYFAIPEDGKVLGEYTQTGLPSFVVRRFPGDDGGWTSVFLGEPVVTPGFFRSLGQMAGARVWNFQDDVVHVRPPFLTVHCSGTGSRTIALPDKWSAYSLVAGDWASTDTSSLTFHALDGSTHVFLVGSKADVEGLISIDPTEFERVEEVAPRAENTLHWDAINFDVPIMKLDQWVEESWSEDLAEDLLLKPSLIEPTPEEEEDDEQLRRSRGRRRRRRRRGDLETRNDLGRESELTMNVLFRKRE